MAQIVLKLQPQGNGQYAVQIETTEVEGGWPTVFAVLLGGLGLVVNQLTPQMPAGNSPVFQAMCGVFQAFLQGIMQAGTAPRIERVVALPPRMPAVADILKH